MPSRIIKESILTSDTLDQLSGDEERFFYRLLPVCDDFGRSEARPAVLKARCFPLKESLPAAAVADWLSGLQRVGLVDLYEGGDKLYLRLRSWERHNKPRAAKSRHPDPVRICPPMTGPAIVAWRPGGTANTCEQMHADASTRKQAQADASTCQQMHAYSYSESYSKKELSSGRPDGQAPADHGKDPTHDPSPPAPTRPPDGGSDEPAKPPALQPEPARPDAIAPSPASEPAPAAASAPAPKPAAAKRDAEITEVLAHWRERAGMPKASIEGSKAKDRRKRILARLGDGFGVAELKLVADGMAKDPFLMGTDPGCKRPGGYRDVETVYRDAAQCERLIALAQGAVPPKPSQTLGQPALRPLPPPASEVVVTSPQRAPGETQRVLDELRAKGVRPSFAPAPDVAAARRREGDLAAPSMTPQQEAERREHVRRQTEELLRQQA